MYLPKFPIKHRMTPNAEDLLSLKNKKRAHTGHMAMNSHGAYVISTKLLEITLHPYGFHTSAAMYLFMYYQDIQMWSVWALEMINVNRTPDFH